jgi:hypothetical protein
LLSFFIYRPFKVVHVEFQFINVPQGIHQRGYFLRALAAKIRQVWCWPAIKNGLYKIPAKVMGVVVVKELSAAPVALEPFSFFI